MVGGAFRGIDTVHADSSVTVSSVSGTFYPYSGSGAFDTSQLSNSVFTQQFPVVDFNPNDGGQSFCSNSTGVSDTTRP
ncbi:MAG: hypothetical protein E6I76_16005, partial [Chloroflexi bacterium]